MPIIETVRCGSCEASAAAAGSPLDPAPAEPGRQSAGTVHHVAWYTFDAEQRQWLERLNAAGIANSGIIDRHYFHSLYFREPGGVLFELATEEPGFTVDGPVEELGRSIILPPWLEAQRASVEARLTPLPDPRAGWGDVRATGPGHRLTMAAKGRPMTGLGFEPG